MKEGVFLELTDELTAILYKWQGIMVIKRDAMFSRKGSALIATALFMPYLVCGLQAEDKHGPVVAKFPSSIPVYVCRQVPDDSVKIDGKLDEDCWKDKPQMAFAEIKDGSAPKYEGGARIVWDSKCLYVGFTLTDPDVWANIAGRESGFVSLDGKWNQRYPGELQIMAQDKFIKIFLDPDGDGLDYLEFHVNAANAVCDLLTYWPYWRCARRECGMRSENENEAEKEKQAVNADWSLPGFKTAVQVDGTLNNPNDKDRGLGIEAALPWSSLQKYCKGTCPPGNAMNWRCHLGWCYRETARGERAYWTWPVLGTVSRSPGYLTYTCHVPMRWGILYFQELEKAAGEGKDAR